MWAHNIEGILFAIANLFEIFSPFMLYNREPVLPIDVRRNLDREKEDEIGDENQEPFTLEYFDAVELQLKMMQPRI